MELLIKREYYYRGVYFLQKSPTPTKIPKFFHRILSMFQAVLRIRFR